MTPTFQGEVQLAGWSESHNGGCKVTFWLADSSDLDAFRAMTVRKGNTAGHRLACVLVEIGEDEQPIPVAPKPGALCSLAVRWCKDPLFQRWLGVRDENAARQNVLDACRVETRKELDRSAEAAEIFNRLFRLPYQKHLRGDGYVA